ncbi:MAG: sulfotransferase [Planctomycetota bacterium]
MTTPLFLVSAPRSGSTFLRGALSAHPEINLTNEAGWIAALRKAEMLTTTPSQERVDDGEGFATVGLIPHAYIGPVHDAFVAAAHSFVDALRRSLGDAGRYFGDKVHSHNDTAFLLRVFDDARLVYLVRDIRDVLVSSYTFEEKQITAWRGASFEQRCEHLATFFARMQELLTGRDHCLVRYEDLVEDPRATIGRILGFLELDPTAEIESWLEHGARELFASHGTSRTPAASVGRWRTMLAPEQQRIADTYLGEHLRRLGYD